MLVNDHLTQISNVLVIGCGGAGLRAAIEIKLAGLEVKVLGKSCAQVTANPEPKSEPMATAERSRPEEPAMICSTSASVSAAMEKG